MLVKSTVPLASEYMSLMQMSAKMPRVWTNESGNPAAAAADATPMRKV